MAWIVLAWIPTVAVLCLRNLKEFFNQMINYRFLNNGRLFCSYDCVQNLPPVLKIDTMWAEHVGAKLLHSVSLLSLNPLTPNDI
jgi:hypothetical protein